MVRFSDFEFFLGVRYRYRYIYMCVVFVVCICSIHILYIYTIHSAMRQLKFYASEFYARKDFEARESGQLNAHKMESTEILHVE